LSVRHRTKFSSHCTDPRLLTYRKYFIIFREKNVCVILYCNSDDDFSLSSQPK